jgi:hypothetical protein
MMKLAHTGAGVQQGDTGLVCDAFQFHGHVRQDYIPNPWTGAVPGASEISPYHYWKCSQDIKTFRAANGLPDVTRPLLSTESGIPYSGNGAVTTGRTDIYQLRRMKYGMVVLGNLYYGVCLVNFYAVGRSAALEFNTIDPANDTTYFGSLGQRDADFAVQALDMREASDSISFPTKTWVDYWKGWQVWFNQNQDPIDGDTTVCPFAEWNRVTFASNTVTMNAGGRNVVAIKKNCGRGEHTFRVHLRLVGTGSQACLRVSGHDKLNGLNLVSSQILSGPTDWTTVEVSFTPRQHGNRRLPDPAYAVLMIDHNGTGTCTASTPVIDMPGRKKGDYFDFTITSISWTPSSPVAGDSVTFSAVVKNVGTIASPAGVICGVAFTVDGDPATKTWSDTITASLSPGQSRTHTANGGASGSQLWTSTAGTHSIEAEVDDINRMPSEYNKNNNVMTQSIIVGTTGVPSVPPPAAAAGLTTLFLNEEFTSVRLYHE